MTVRSVFFWCHLTAGVCTGLVILLMSLTGVLLMYERQILSWADSDYRSVPRDPASQRLPLERLLASINDADPSVRPSALTVRADSSAPVIVSAGTRTLFVDAYSGAVLGEASRVGARAVMGRLREWHRWLALSGDRRAAGRAVTGWSTAVFAGIVCSGFYLWLPRRWTRKSVRKGLFVRAGLRGKARDFNWHNAVGVWAAVPLLLIVLSALPISFPWANALLYRAAGEQPPPAAPAAPRAREAVLIVDGLDRAFTRAAQQVDGWRSISVRLGPDPAYVFTIDRGNGGQPQFRDTLTVNRSGELVRFEPFSAQTLGRRLRSISRFTHTGEVLGIAGQTIAGVASAGAVVLVWTGLSLAWRRFFSRRTAAALDGDRERSAA